MDRFEIVELQPIKSTWLWRARVSISTPDTVEGVGVGQVAVLNVRFSYSADQSVQGLLEAAFDAAKQCLASAADHASTQSLSDLLDQEETVRAEQDKLFEYPSE